MLNVSFRTFFCLGAIALWATGAAGAAEPSPSGLRVGFFEFNGYHMQDAAGRRSGYGYDLLQMLRPYLPAARFEYVGYDKGWAENLAMLERGELDLLTSAVKTPEKLEKFDFSDMPVGSSSVIMTVKTGHRNYQIRDYQNWNGIRVGMLSGNSKNDVFARFAREKGFSFEPRYFAQTDELTRNLQEGRVDAIVTGSLRKIRNELIYEQIDIQPFYIIVKKGNRELLSRINRALDALVLETPGFAGELRQIYYGHWRQGRQTVPFTAAELDFIRSADEEDRHFTVLLQPDQFPLEYLKDGKPQGIFADIALRIARASGLRLELTAPRTLAEYFELRARKKCDLIMDLPHDFQWAEEAGYILTKPYYQVSPSMLFRKRSLGEVKTVGTLKDSILQRFVEQNKPQDVTATVFPSNDAAVEAVKTGKIDGAYLLGPLVDNVLLNDRTGTLTQEQSGRIIDFAVGIRADADGRLISIVSKSLNHLTRQDILKISRRHNLLLERDTKFRDLVAENPLTVSLSLIGLVLILGGALTVVLVYHRRAVGAAARLEKNSRMWKLLLDSLPVHIFAKDATNGFRFVYNNKARGNFYGIPAEKMNGQDDFAILPPDLAAVRRRADEQLCAAGTGMNEAFVRIPDPNGQPHQLYTVLVPFSDADGTSLILACSVDQTELLDARKRAEENAEWFQKTLISIGDGVLTTDDAGNITLLNPVAEKMLGVTLAECRGKAHTEYFQIVSYLDGAPVPSPVERCLNAGEIVTLANHTDLISRDGTRYHIADSAAPIRDQEGRIAGAILVFRDVTREYELRDRLQTSADQLRDALDQAQRASSAKGVFLSQMSHEIRTPLNAIIGYLNLAQESGDAPARIKEYLGKGLAASGHLLSIINDILDISSIESGKLKIAHEDFDFKRLLTGIVSMFYTQAEARQIKFEMQLRDLTEEWLIGDSLRVNQILLNLLSNALKFTPAGGSVTLTVKQLAIVRNRVQLMLQVSDTGCGMSAEYQSRLFQPFEQQDASTARRFGGTGLGLSITRNLVAMMGGTIEVDSREKAGTTFTVHLPFERSAKTQTIADADFSKLRALVVDDREDDRTYLQMVLTKCGVKSDAVDSGEAAIRQLERRRDSRHPYDLCLLDLRLSGIDGLETTRRMRQLGGITPDLPIILVTAYDVSGIADEAHTAGVNRIIQKPLFQSTFFDFLMSSYYHLSEKQNSQEIKAALNGLHLLLVEDNQMNMDISTQYLERAGMKITPAWNGREAVERFEASAPGSFQAILMDIQMPVMDGYQATAAIRASRHPDAKTVPIIAMTANAFNEDVVMALRAGMNDHIAKPIVYDRLFASLSKLTAKKVAP